MQLSSLQLECQRLGADMTLSTWCILQSFYDDSYHILILWKKKRNWCIYQVGNQDNSDYTNEEDMMDSYKNHWHPIDRGRLCYLSQDCKTVRSKKSRNTVEFRFKQRIDLLQKDILERDEKTLEYVKSFLLSIKQDNIE